MYFIVQVKACSEYSKTCGQWSEKMEAATLDGVPGKPSDVQVKCSVDYMNLTWSPPLKPNAEIKGYTVSISYLDTLNQGFLNYFGQETPLPKLTDTSDPHIQITNYYKSYL